MPPSADCRVGQAIGLLTLAIWILSIIIGSIPNSNNSPKITFTIHLDLIMIFIESGYFSNCFTREFSRVAAQCIKATAIRFRGTRLLIVRLGTFGTFEQRCVTDLFTGTYQYVQLI